MVTNEDPRKEATSPGSDVPPGDWSRLGRVLEGYFPDVIRRAVAGGIRSFLQSEEGIRTLLGAAVPREMVNLAADQVERAKSEIVRRVGEEFRSFLERTDLTTEVQRLLTSLSIEVRTQVRFVPNDRAVVRPDVQTDIRVTGDEEPEQERRRRKSRKRRTS